MRVVVVTFDGFKEIETLWSVRCPTVAKTSTSFLAGVAVRINCKFFSACLNN